MDTQESTTAPVQVWTVVGLWHNDQPIPVAAIRGDHGVDGGFHPEFMIEFQGGMWAVTVEAATDTEAEENAVSVMSEDEDEDEECEGHESLAGAHMGVSVTCGGPCR